MTIASVSGATALEAWKAGVHALLEGGGELKNLITTVTRPCERVPEWLLDRSPGRFLDGADDIRDVVNTIFPAKTWAKSADRAEFYKKYLEMHDRKRRWKGGRHAWGTYFERLVRFPPNGTNQLERAIQKLMTWPRNTTGLVFHLSSPVVDAPRTRGGPCWHFGELIWNLDGTLDLVVVYRNHDFFNKVLGNFIGLGYLLEFICSASGREPGALVCHSVHAYSDGTIRALRAMAG